MLASWQLSMKPLDALAAGEPRRGSARRYRLFNNGMRCGQSESASGHDDDFSSREWSRLRRILCVSRIASLNVMARVSVLSSVVGVSVLSSVAGVSVLSSVARVLNFMARVLNFMAHVLNFMARMF